MDKKDILKLNQIVYKYILNLKDDDIKNILEGNKKLSLEDKTKRNNKKTNTEDIEKLSQKLEVVSSKSEARKYIESNKFTNDVLKSVAKVKKISLNSRSNKAEIIDKLIEGTIGAKVKINILQGK